VSEKIIKPGVAAETPASSSTAARVLKGHAYDATVHAAQIIEAAHAETRQILEVAGQEKQTVLEAARKEGYDQGLQLWHAAVEEANAVRDRRLADSESELVQLAVRIAEKIIGEELRLNPQAILSIARQCLQWLRRERSLMLRVSPAELSLLRESIDSLREVAGPQRSIEVIGDPGISPGGCIVESEYGVIDARLETQIRSMEEILQHPAMK
jgi:type III secretion protein L